MHDKDAFQRRADKKEKMKPVQNVEDFVQAGVSVFLPRALQPRL